MDVEFKELTFNSEFQIASIELRREVLRKPLGLDFNEVELAAENSQYHLAGLMNNQVIAILLLKNEHEEPDALRMRQVAVSPHYQGKGLGKKLVQFSEEFARMKGFKTFKLHARSNVKDFYTGMGYQAEGDTFMEVGIPHLFMWKEI